MNDGAQARASSFRRELARKAIHLSSAAIPIFLALGGARVIALSMLGILTLAAIVVEISRAASATVASRFESLFLVLLRSHESRQITGATWLLAAMFMAVLLFPREIAITATWAAAVGDAAAALVGMRYGHHRSRRDGKSIEGSVACLLATTAGAVLLARLGVGAAVLSGTAATIGERMTWPRDDNIRIIAAIGAVGLILAAR